MDKNNIHSIPYILLVLMAFFPLMPHGIITGTTIVLAITSVFFNLKGEYTLSKQRTKLIIINTLFYCLMCINFFYSSNTDVALRELVRDLNLLIFPLAIIGFHKKISKKKFNTILKAFAIANTILLLILITFTIIHLFENKHLKSFSSIPFRNIIESKTYLKLHPTYVAMWFSFTIIYITSEINKARSNLIKGLLILLSGLFYISILFLATRIVFLSLHIVLLVYVFFFLHLKSKVKLKFLLISIITLGVLFLAMSRIDTFKDRFFKETFKEVKIPKGRKPNSLSIRYGIYSCDFNLVKQNVLFGYGVGDVQENLNNCYRSSFKTSVYKRRDFDSHNYYFYLLLSGGIIILFLFLYMLYKNYHLAILHREHLYISLLIIITICCLTENVLARVHGTVFFSFFNALFLLKMLSKKSNESK